MKNSCELCIKVTLIGYTALQNIGFSSKIRHFSLAKRPREWHTFGVTATLKRRAFYVLRFASGNPDSERENYHQKEGGSTYVLFQYGQDYKPDRKYAIPQRAIIGKVNPDDTSRMFPNEKYEIYFPDAVIPEELPEAYRSCALKIGSYVVIKKVFDDYGLPDMLRKRFGSDTGLLMDLVSYLIVEEESVGQYYPDFAFDHPLFSEKMRIYSDSKISRFLKSFTKEQIAGFLDDWNKKRDHKQCIYISYDSTNKNGQAGDIDLLEYGKAKDNKGFPIFNLAVAYDENNRVPLFYETYGGSINDVAQFTCMVDKVIDYGYKKVGFILDRGYFSKENIRYLEANRFPFIMMVKGYKRNCKTTRQRVKANRLSAVHFVTFSWEAV